MEWLVKTLEYLKSNDFLENSLLAWTKVGLLILLSVVLMRFFTTRISLLIYKLVRSYSTQVPIKEFISLFRKPLAMLIYLAVAYYVTTLLSIPDAWQFAPAERFGIRMVFWEVYRFMFLISFFWFLFRAVDFLGLVLQKQAQGQNARLREHLIPFIKQLSKIVLSIVFVFSTLGYVFGLNVGSIITGLGIGGIAVALAGKETLENLLATVAIFIDKPFVAGDLIKIDNVVGNIETVGFRTTRIRTLDKSLVTIPNKQMIDKPLENLTNRQMHRVRQVFIFSYEYDKKTIEHILQLLKDILQAHDYTENTRVAFLDDFGESGYQITLIYTINAVEYREFWARKEKINLQLLEAFQEHGYKLEYPTKTVLLKNT